MKQYLDLLKDVLENGVEKGDRTGTGTLSVFGRQMRFNLQDGFPLVTTKKVHLRSIIHELLWFLMGDTNIKYLNDNGVTIWDEWALKEDETIGYTMDNAERVRYAIHHQLYDGSLRDLTQYLNSLGNDELGHAYLDSIGVPKDITHVTKHKGSLGPVYGKQWVDWVNTKGEHINQIKKVIDLLTSDPDSRRIYVSAINVGELKEMHLEPCFVGGTPILTPFGYVDIENVAEGDLILSDKSNIKKVLAKWITHYSGDVFTIKTVYDSIPVECTPNHPFLIRTGEYAEAKSLEVGQHLLIPRSKVSDKPYSFEYSKVINYNKKEREIKYRLETHELTENDYFTLGYFVGNGWFSPGSNTVSFSIPVTKIDKILPIIRKTIKVSYKSMPSTTVNTYHTVSQKWSELLKDFGHMAHNKRIPEWVLCSPKKYLLAFLNGYLEADGYLKSSGAYTCTTVSRSLAYGLQRLCVNLNKLAAIHFQRRPKTTVIEGRTVNQRDTYTVIINTRSMFDIIFDDKGMWVPIQKIHTLEKKCDVFNLEVEDDNTYVVKNIATHNCHNYFQFGTRLLNVNQRIRYAKEHLAEEWESFKESQHAAQSMNDEWITDAEWVENNTPERGLNCYFQLRSNDLFLGCPFNIASYALLTHMVAQQVGMVPLELVYSGVDAHIYNNHMEQVKLQLTRDPLPLPKLVINRKPASIFDYKFEDFELKDYESHPTIKAPVAI